jgi:hypothetical protein
MRGFSMLRSIIGVGLVGVMGASCASLPTLAEPTSWNLRSDRYRAAYEIAAARCDRQTPACESRAGVHYASRDACIEAKLPTSVVEAHLDYCASYALRASNLSACVAGIQSGQCGTGVSPVSACRGPSLCPWDDDEAPQP